MYLSKVKLQVIGLNNAHVWHKALWTLFPNIEPGSHAPFLFRIEKMNLSKGADLLVQSDYLPEKSSHLARVLAHKSWEPQFREGQRLIFSLRANPTKKIRDQDDRERKIRVPLIKEEEQKNWLRRKLSDAGEIRALDIQNNPPIYFRKGSRAGKVVPVSFEGILEVQHPDALRQIWKNGIGPAKAFGCGMLMLKRI